MTAPRWWQGRFPSRIGGVLLLAVALLTVAAILTAGAPPVRADKITYMPPGPQPIGLKVTPIPYFRISYPNQYRFGSLEYLDGLELWSRNRDFGGLSSLVTLDDGKRIVAVSDNGLWFDAFATIDPAGQMTGLHDARLAPMLTATGEPMMSVRDADAESLALGGTPDDPRFLVSFERDHRIESFPVDLDNFRSAGTRLKIPAAIRRLRPNTGLEAIAVPDDACPLGGATVVAIAERDRDRNADIPGWIIGGSRPGSFHVRRIGDFSITDSAFLPDGDLLILERRFNFADGVGMRLRRIPCRSLSAGGTIDGATLLEADLSYQIDNMEGLDVHTDRRTGKTILTLVSDDNRSILQRTLLLRFELREAPHPAAKGETQGSGAPSYGDRNPL